MHTARKPRENRTDRKDLPFALRTHNPHILVSFPLLPSLSPSTPRFFPLPHLLPQNVRHSPTKQLHWLQPSVSFFFSPTSSFSLTPRHIGPLTQNVKRSLNITNPNADPISFKIKTTAPKVRLFTHNKSTLPLISPPLAILRKAQLRKGRARPDS